MSVWWARVETAQDGIHLYEMPDGCDQEAVLAGLRAAHGIPDDWYERPERGTPTVRTPDGRMLPATAAGWDVAIIGGPVHESLVAVATMHPLEG